MSFDCRGQCPPVQPLSADRLHGVLCRFNCGERCFLMCRGRCRLHCAFMFRNTYRYSCRFCFRRYLFPIVDVDVTVVAFGARGRRSVTIAGGYAVCFSIVFVVDL